MALGIDHHAAIQSNQLFDQYTESPQSAISIVSILAALFYLHDPKAAEDPVKKILGKEHALFALSYEPSSNQLMIIHVGDSGETIRVRFSLISFAASLISFRSAILVIAVACVRVTFVVNLFMISFLTIPLFRLNAPMRLILLLLKTSERTAMALQATVVKRRVRTRWLPQKAIHSSLARHVVCI